MREFRILIIVIAAIGCVAESAPTVVPTATAHSDGFEVVVFDMRDGVPENVRSIPLKQAEEEVADGSQVEIFGQPESVQDKLKLGKGGDSFARISVETLPEAGQKVHTSFHYSNRTYWYEYVVNGNRISPTASGYRDLRRTSAVLYHD